jgi:adenosylcobinamide kinase/adenosylcobinamide-phosphate guanylyltransferase
MFTFYQLNAVSVCFSSLVNCPYWRYYWRLPWWSTTNKRADYIFCYSQSILNDGNRLMLHLVLGGARSGKSSFAEACVISQAKIRNVIPLYIATAQALDEEMNKRIEHHQALRIPHNWRLLECPELLTEQLDQIDESDFVLIDCLTLWLTNHLMQRQKYIVLNAKNKVLDESSSEEMGEYSCKDIGEYLGKQVDKLVAALERHPATIVVVSNEIGLGVVPMGKETRRFVDHAGWMNQKLAKVAQQVTLVTAGLPMSLKTSSDVSQNEDVHRG